MTLDGWWMTDDGWEFSPAGVYVKQLDAYTRLLGLPNVWIHNDGSKVYLCQVLLYGLKIAVSRSANNLRNASYNSMSKLKTK